MFRTSRKPRHMLYFSINQNMSLIVCEEKKERSDYYALFIEWALV